MNRQPAFESIYAKQHGVPAESLVQYRFESKDGYSLPGIASHYRTYCDTLDSIVIEVPELINCGEDMGCAFLKAIEAAGVKYK